MKANWDMILVVDGFEWILGQHLVDGGFMEGCVTHDFHHENSRASNFSKRFTFQTQRFFEPSNLFHENCHGTQQWGQFSRPSHRRRSRLSTLGL